MMNWNLIILVILAFTPAKSSTLVTNRTKRDTTSKCPSCQSALCAPKFAVYPSHTACLEKSSEATSVELTSEEKQALVTQHNNLRAAVNPIPVNMLKMSWDDEVEMLAKRWAERCTRGPDGRYAHDTLRFIPGRFPVGQNLGDGFEKFEDVVTAWYNEKTDFAPYYGNPNMAIPNTLMIGHYTQVVWAGTNLLGCAKAICKDNRKTYVCNYGPAGNYQPLNTPYQTGAVKGEKCKTKTEDGLCDCPGISCENEGTMDSSTCQCVCQYKDRTVPPSCSLNCSIHDGVYCGTQAGFMSTDCNNPYTNAACPNLCGICPCAEKTFKATMCDSDKGKENSASSLLLSPWDHGLIADYLPGGLRGFMTMIAVVSVTAM